MQIMKFNGRDIKFQAFHYRYDQVSVQDNPDDDRSMLKNGMIVIYQNGGTVYYIVDQNTHAKKLLRKLLGYTGRNELEKNCFDLPDDFFVWLVNQVYNSNVTILNTSADDEKVLTLEEIKGIRGDTEDLQTSVSASGESVMNVISTLSFLLESRRLNQVILTLKYTGHSCICMKVQKSTIEAGRPYKGEFDQDGSEALFAKLYLLMYIEVIPLLELEYRAAKEEYWNEEAYIEFLEGLKADILGKIEEKIAYLKSSTV